MNIKNLNNFKRLDTLEKEDLLHVRRNNKDYAIKAQNMSVNSTVNNTADTYLLPKTFGTIVPLYNYPSGYSDEDWNTFFDLSRKYRGVSTIVIINPNNGVFTEFSDNWDSVINRSIGGGIIPVGYIYSEYGERSLSDIKANVDAYLEFYPKIKGFFIDEYSTDLDNYDFYVELSTYIREKGFSIIIGNAGTPQENIYFNNRVCDIFCEYESEGYPDAERCYGQSYSQDLHSINERCALCRGCPTLEEEAMERMKKGFKWIYVQHNLSWSTLTELYEELLQSLSENY